MRVATNPHAAGHPADALLGRWHLTRRIEDFRAGAEAAFTGQATLARTATGLHWAEEGILRIAATQTTARRAYLWQLIAPDLVDVAYEDGRPFHRFTMAPGASQAVRHDCAPDLYEGTYTFAAPDLWHLTWRVRGPRKDYRMTTAHRRAVPGRS